MSCPYKRMNLRHAVSPRVRVSNVVPPVPKEAHAPPDNAHGPNHVHGQTGGTCTYPRQVPVSTSCFRLGVAQTVIHTLIPSCALATQVSPSKGLQWHGPKYVPIQSQSPGECCSLIVIEASVYSVLPVFATVESKFLQDALLVRGVKGPGQVPSSLLHTPDT